MGNEQALEDGDLNKEFSDLEPDAVELLKTGNIEKDDYTDDAKDYSENVNKRIGKEVAKTKKANGRATEAETSRDIYKERYEEGQRKLAELAKSNLERENALYKDDIDKLPAKAALALEEGRSEDYVELDGRVTSARINLSKNETELANHEESYNQAPPDKAPAQQPGSGEKPMSSAAKDWMERNQDWIDADPERFARAQNISKQLERKGYNVSSDKIYAEIDNRLGEYTPPGDGGDGGGEELPKPQHGNINVPGGGTPPPRSPNKLRLSAEDLRLMKTVNLDPKNAEHRRAYAEGKG